jgi:uncharacterized protein (TIGR02147 family)
VTSNIYEFLDYKKYLNDLIDSDQNHGRGKKKKLAEFIGCQVSHISNVLSGPGHFSAEQAEVVTRFFGLNPSETDYFLTLVQMNRAGTNELKQFYQNNLQEKSEKYLGLKNRLKMPDSLVEGQEARYYSSWHFAAVHVCTSIPGLQTRDALANKFNLSLRRTDEILNFLCETGLIKKEGIRFVISRPMLHLDKKSPNIFKHHTNWRLRAAAALDQFEKSSLHYSSVVSISQKDIPKVQDIFSKALTEAINLISKSPEEECAVICLDLFKL